MKKEEYRACMAKGLKGKTGLSKQQRQDLFCVESRICSGKAKDEEEAKRLCSQPKAPKAAASQPRARAETVPQTSAPATMKSAPVDPAHCEVAAFTEVARMYRDLYVYVYPEKSDCGHCNALRARILEADIPHPIVDMPGDVCHELADSFGVDRYPSVVRLRRGKVKAVHTGNPDVVIRKMTEGK